MRIISIVLAVIMAAILVSFIGCGPKPPAKPTKAEKPHFEVTVEKDSRVVVVSFPLLAVPANFADSTLYVYAAYYVLVDSTWSPMVGNDYRVDTDKKSFPKLYGRIRLPEKGDWFIIRTWVRMDTGRRMMVWPKDPYAREDKSGKYGYEFVVNIVTGENHPVLKRE